MTTVHSRTRHDVTIPLFTYGSCSAKASATDASSPLNTRTAPSGGSANAPALRDWSVGYQEALHPYSAGGAYLNMIMDEGEERIRASYRDNYDRLARIKAEYDPDNLFRVNQNIRPAAG